MTSTKSYVEGFGRPSEPQTTSTKLARSTHPYMYQGKYGSFVCRTLHAEGAIAITSFGPCFDPQRATARRPPWRLPPLVHSRRRIPLPHPPRRSQHLPQHSIRAIHLPPAELTWWSRFVALALGYLEYKMKRGRSTRKGGGVRIGL